MTADPETVVRQFIDAWNSGELAPVLALMADDIVYHNIPMSPVIGLAAVRAYLEAAGPFSQVDWQLLHVAAKGPVVLTERIDAFVKGGKAIALPVMGTFEISDGKITAWRDYFDLAMYREQLSKGV